MKVKLEIELEMETELEESDIIKTKQELLNGIRIAESDVKDGFEITTDFSDCDNTEDFFIKPHSARITAIKCPEFSKEELWVNDIEINDDCDGVSSQFETHFDPDEKFGTHINGEDNSWVNFYAEYFPESRELKCEYYLATPLIEKSNPYYPTEEEKELIINAMEEFCLREENMSISEFVAEFSNEINMNM